MFRLKLGYDLKFSHHFVLPFLVFSLISPFGLLPLLGTSAAAEESHRLAAVRSLGLAKIPGSMPTFYSPHSEMRARYLQNLLQGELTYFANHFHVRFAPINMAVLNADQWSKVAGDDPYGMPSVNDTKPYVFVMPANWENVMWIRFPKREEVDPAILRQALTGGKTWDEVKFEGADGIGTHEIGHAVIAQLGIGPQTKWLSEFLASYAGYAYLKAKYPRQALSNEIFWAFGLNAPHPFTTLDEFERKYTELMQEYPANYGWYQCALDQRVIEIYQQNGVEFLGKVKRNFPKDGPKMDTAQVLAKLEIISPGWKAWAVRVKAGDVKAVRLKAER